MAKLVPSRRIAGRLDCILTNARSQPDCSTGDERSVFGSLNPTRNARAYQNNIPSVTKHGAIGRTLALRFAGVHGYLLLENASRQPSSIFFIGKISEPSTDCFSQDQS